MRDCHPVTTPIDFKSKLSSNVGPPVASYSLYRSLAGALQYATLTRSDMSYVAQQIFLHMHDPHEPHFSLIERVLRYLKGTLHYGLTLIVLPLFLLLPSRMPIGQVARIPAALCQGFVYIWEII
jgi:hypothetical protein